MDPRDTVLVYHGCDRAVGEMILAGEEDVRISTNDYDWLGSGAYFWEGSPTRALQWAKFLQSNPSSSPSKIKEPFAIGAILSTGNCLDLTEADSLEILRSAYDEYARPFVEFDIPSPINIPGYDGDADLVKRHLDCAVINFLHTLREETDEPPFDTIRCPYFEGQPLFPGAKIAAQTHLQWCVREPRSSVVGYFRLRS